MPRHICAMVVVIGALAIASISPLAQSASSTLVGVVEIPAVLGTAGGRAASARRASVALRRGPDEGQPVIAVVGADGELRTEAVDYTEGFVAAAHVLQRRNGWNLVRLRDGRSGWLSPADAGRFHSLVDVMEKAEFLTAAAGTRLAARPAGERTIPFPPDPLRSLIGYAEPVGRYSAVPVRARPSSSATRVRVIGAQSSEKPVSPDGSDKIVVFARRPGWLQVGFGDQWRYLARGWVVDDPKIWRFHALTRAERERLLAENWEGGLRGVRVRQTRTIAGRLWLHIDILRLPECERALFTEEPATALATGWIPAVAENGAPTAWFQPYCD